MYSESMNIHSRVLFLFLFVLPLFTLAQTNKETTPVKKQKDYGKSFFAKDSIHFIKINFNQCNFWDSLTYYRKISDSLEISTYMQASILVDSKRFYACG